MIFIKNSTIIPSAIQICMDDIGWFNGNDRRHLGQPSSTGMPRRHVAEDYIIVNEIGKAIGMKIMCPLVIGEWDKDNILTNEVGTTYEPYTWDRASKIDLNAAKRIFDIIKNSEYIEFALHGVMHGNYAEDGRQITEMEYFEEGTDENGKTKLFCMPEEEILRRINVFEKIYESWGFDKKIRSYAAPNEFPSHTQWEDLSPMVSAFNKKGIKYWTNYWKGKECTGKYLEGILYTVKSNKIIVPWNAYDVDPKYIDDFWSEEDQFRYSILGLHWPNFLKFHPENNMQTLPLWVDYFKKQSEIFGLMISKDIAFSSNQHIYGDLSKIEFENNVLKIDVSNVYTQPSVDPFGYFYVSIKNEFTPICSEGCTYELYEKHRDFSTYKITHTAKMMNITLK